MAVILKGKTAVWGVKTENGDTFAEAAIVSQSLKDSAETEKMPNNDSETTGLVIYDKNTVADITLLMEAATTAPAIGADIQIAGQSAIVLDVQKNWEARGWKKLTVSATNWAAFQAGA